MRVIAQKIRTLARERCTNSTYTSRISREFYYSTFLPPAWHALSVLGLFWLRELRFFLISRLSFVYSFLPRHCVFTWISRHYHTILTHSVRPVFNEAKFAVFFARDGGMMNTIPNVEKSEKERKGEKESRVECICLPRQEKRRWLHRGSHYELCTPLHFHTYGVI